MTVPDIQPMTGEVLDALALEMFEHDVLRAQHGLPPRDGRRTFSKRDLDRGEQFKPTAMLDHAGNLLVNIKNGQ
jgi:hypothetical protein